ncbi:hypothetical protein [Massilia scottii]|uniref:hypothetical protein n=1 Tax=Massilia scottii TaxID=3057166 RepID=UPI0027969A83|nr:hypothetical protein [Massilia sp. CCM 9029]MDQ1830372.1 hypothetical protein [Massilia sp. CCM 9029]
MTALTRLKLAEEAMREGRHEEALQEFIWFHHHALEEDPSLSDARAYALSFWMELGQAYPKALDALRSIRSDKADALLRGEAELEWFWDIVLIDAELGNTAATYQLYLALAEAWPAFAKECARVAIPAIVEAQDYELAASLMPPPETLVRELATMLEQEIASIKQQPFSRTPVRWGEITWYAEEVKRLVAIQTGIGDHAEAARIKALAISLIKSPSVRRDVAAGFIKRSRPPRFSRR